MKKKVVVGMSGGVDSSVAAYLLKEQGYDVIGVTMHLGDFEAGDNCDQNGGCCGISAIQDARRVADVLQIPYYVMNFKQEFQEKVIDYFVSSYADALTPNPCIACNRYIKWETLLKKSMEIGADYIATGHYARIEKLDNGRLALKKSYLGKKDQTYALYNLTQDQLAHTLMPVGHYEKSEIRTMAAKIGLNVADKPDSQEICFVTDNDYAGFVKRQLHEESSMLKGFQEGDFVDVNGNILGRHKGLVNYTIGQRRGLQIAMGKRIFVVRLDQEKNQVVLGDDSDLFTTTLKIEDINHMAWESFEVGQNVVCKIRYSHQGAPAVVTKVEQNRMEIEFLEPVRAITPGQAAVFYEGDYVLGGGTIIT